MVSKQVLDSWDAAEDSEVEREKAAKAAAAKAKAEAEAAAKKKPKSLRIEEHKEANRRRKAEQEQEESEEEDESERRARLRATEKDSDLKHAEDLFGDIDLNRNRGAPKAVVVEDASADPTKAVDLSSMPLFKPATKDQFTKLTNTLIPLLTAQSKKPQYAIWVVDFAKQLVKELNSADVKKVASALTTVSNEKLKEERLAEKGGKKTKAAKNKVSLVTGSSKDITKFDANDYAGDDLDDDDFM